MPGLPTPKWPWVGRQWSTTTTLYSCWPVTNWYGGSAHSLFLRVTSWGTQKILESQYDTARLDGKRDSLIEKTEQRMNYCQRSLRVLMLALVQIYSTREQSTLRHISRPVFCSTRHGRKLSKHCEMYNSYSLYNPPRDFVAWHPLQQRQFSAAGLTPGALVQIKIWF